MLPSIDTQERFELSDDRVLIRIRPHLKSSGLGILHQPSPSAPLYARQFRVHDFLQSIKSSVCLIDGLAQLSAWGLSSTGRLGGEVLPEEGMIDVAAAVEVDERLEGNLGGGGFGRGGRGKLLGSGVVRIHIGLVMFGVMKFHDLAGDGGLEGAIIICRKSISD